MGIILKGTSTPILKIGTSPESLARAIAEEKEERMTADSLKADKNYVDGELAKKADTDSVPTKTSELDNDSGFLTQHQDISGKADKSELPTKVSELENDSGYLTEHQSLEEYIKKAEALENLCPKNTVSGYPISVSDALAGEHPIKLCVYGCKNLIRYPYVQTTKTVNGITFTDNGDGTITANGTATADAVFEIPAFTVEAKVQYFISGCPAGGSLSTYYFQMRGFTQDVGRGAKIRSSYGFTNTFEIVIRKGTAADSLVFKPQLEEGTAATEYAVGTGIGDLNGGSYTIPVKITGDGTEEKTVTAISDNPLFGGEYIDLVSKTRKGSSGTAGVTVSGDISLYDENTITCETAAVPAKLEITYYRDINKVITDLTNAILSQGGNV